MFLKNFLPIFQPIQDHSLFMQKLINLIYNWLICFQYEWNGGLKLVKNTQSLK